MEKNLIHFFAAVALEAIELNCCCMRLNFLNLSYNIKYKKYLTAYTFFVSSLVSCRFPKKSSFVVQKSFNFPPNTFNIKSRRVRGNLS